MPVRKCSNNKYKIGSGPCMYKSKASAERAYDAYRAIKYSKKSVSEMVDPIDIVSFDVPLLIRLLELAREDLDSDVKIHQVAQRIIEKSKYEEALGMDDYDYIIQDLNLEQDEYKIDESELVQKILNMAHGSSKKKTSE